MEVYPGTVCPFYILLLWYSYRMQGKGSSSSSSSSSTGDGSDMQDTPVGLQPSKGSTDHGGVTQACLEAPTVCSRP